MPNASRLAREIRADCLKIRSYADSLVPKRAEGGRAVAKSENKKRKNMIISPERIIPLVRSAPYTSVITSFIENTSGIRKIVILALSLIRGVFRRENVFTPITSAVTIQKIYKEIRKSTLLICVIDIFMKKL
jgi:hypothetical protein